MRYRRSLFAALAGCMLAALITPLRTTVVRGSSMNPTLASGSLQVLDTRYYRHHAVERGDVVVFTYLGQTCTKRVYAVPGDEIYLYRYDDNSADDVVAPGDLDAARRLRDTGHLVSRRLSRLIVPPGQYYVLGDNQPVSWDSRAFGCLPKEAILGRLMH